ncbi:hypothetical protein [Rahnella sp. PCH160]|uniref:hypothetical protein n=1 Tax=Rahnella sp. PCH160 TaxID=3447928 RepID=UPI0039FC0EE0
MAQIKKKIALVFFVLFLGVISIEGGMRFAIWRSLREVVPEKASYTLLIEKFEVLDMSIGCITKGDSNYLGFFYTPWILSSLKAKIICRYTSEHMQLRIFTNERVIDYHWSFSSLSFKEDLYN